MSKITIGYWDVRGLAEPIRYLLHYKGVKFNDKRYQFGSDVWPNDKYNLGLEFPNLPYYIDDDVRLTQSLAILRYLATKYDVGGQTKQQKLRVSLVEQQIIDIRNGLVIILFDKEYEKKRSEFERNAAVKLKELVEFLGGNEFLVGADVAYVDFMMVDTLDFYRYFSPSILDAFQSLLAYQKRVKNLPQLQEYLNSSTFKRWPIFGPTVFWGASGDEPKLD